MQLNLSGDSSEPSPLDNLFSLLQSQIKTCRRCCNKLGVPRVAGEGEIKDIDILIIGEYPCKDSAKARAPFQGKAGNLLRKTLTEIGYDLSTVYLTYAYKCLYTGEDPPPNEELRSCKQHLYREIMWLEPKMIVSFGLTSYLALIEPPNTINPELTMVSLHGTQGTFRDIPVTYLYPPSYIVRNPMMRLDWMGRLRQVKEGL